MLADIDHDEQRGAESIVRIESTISVSANVPSER